MALFSRRNVVVFNAHDRERERERGRGTICRLCACRRYMIIIFIADDRARAHRWEIREPRQTSKWKLRWLRVETTTRRRRAVLAEVLKRKNEREEKGNIEREKKRRNWVKLRKKRTVDFGDGEAANNSMRSVHCRRREKGDELYAPGNVSHCRIRKASGGRRRRRCFTNPGQQYGPWFPPVKNNTVPRVSFFAQLPLHFFSSKKRQSRRRRRRKLYDNDDDNER